MWETTFFFAFKHCFISKKKRKKKKNSSRILYFYSMMESTDEAPPVEQETTREMIPIRREGQLTQYRTYVPELDDETKGIVFYGFPYEHEFDRYSLHIPKASSNSKRSYSDISTDDSLHHKNLTEQAIFLHSLITTFPNDRLDSAEFLTTFLAPFNNIHDIAIIINH
jgi:hypothetical protein